VSDPDSVLEASKVSTLESRVKQQRLKKESCALLMSQLTSPSAPVADYDQLRAACGRNKYQLALLAMLEASIRFDLGQSKKEEKIFFFVLFFQLNKMFFVNTIFYKTTSRFSFFVQVLFQAKQSICLHQVLL